MITPLEIENKKFAKQMVNGYSVNEVDEFLDEIMADYEKFYKENAEIKTKLEDLENSVKHYKSIENTIQSALVMAQTTAEDVKSIATQKANQIIEAAESSSRKSVDELNQLIVMKKSEIEETKQQFNVYKAKIEALLISQLELLKEMSE